MRFHPFLISSFLLASAVSANQELTAGSILTGLNNLAFRSVSTSVTIPQLYGNVGDSITVAATLQSTDCPSLVYVGFNCYIGASFQTSCMGWTHVNPGTSKDFTDLAFGPGDTVSFGATSPYNDGIYVFIENTSTSATRSIAVTPVVCGMEAGWVVSNTPDDNGSYIQLARFGRLEFTTTTAQTPDGRQHGPVDSMGGLFNMTDSNGQLIAIASGDGNSMVITDIRG